MKLPVKRTRRHVTVKLTPDQARALATITRTATPGIVPERQRQKLVQIGREAGRLADQEPPPAPTPTSFGRPARFKDGTN